MSSRAEEMCLPTFTRSEDKLFLADFWVLCSKVTLFLFIENKFITISFIQFIHSWSSSLHDVCIFNTWSCSRFFARTFKSDLCCHLHHFWVFIIFCHLFLTHQNAQNFLFLLLLRTSLFRLVFG